MSLCILLAAGIIRRISSVHGRSWNWMQRSGRSRCPAIGCGLRKTGDVHRKADSLLCSRLESRKETIRITAHVPAAAGPFFLRRGYRKMREEQVCRLGISLSALLWRRSCPAAEGERNRLFLFGLFCTEGEGGNLRICLDNGCFFDKIKNRRRKGIHYV